MVHGKGSHPASSTPTPKVGKCPWVESSACKLKVCVALLKANARLDFLPLQCFPPLSETQHTLCFLLATLVALHFTPVSKWAEFRTSVASRLASLFLPTIPCSFSCLSGLPLCFLAKSVTADFAHLLRAQWGPYPRAVGRHWPDNPWLEIAQESKIPQIAPSYSP